MCKQIYVFTRSGTTLLPYDTLSRCVNSTDGFSPTARYVIATFSPIPRSVYPAKREKKKRIARFPLQKTSARNNKVVGYGVMLLLSPISMTVFFHNNRSNERFRLSQRVVSHLFQGYTLSNF